MGSIAGMYVWKELLIKRVLHGLDLSFGRANPRSFRSRRLEKTRSHSVGSLYRILDGGFLTMTVVRRQSSLHDLNEVRRLARYPVRLLRPATALHESWQEAPPRY